MKDFEAEVAANFQKFGPAFKKSILASFTSLEKQSEKFLESYRTIVSLQAWRSTLLEPTISTGSMAFFLEAQNDALTSHALARVGAWRSALMSLRSCLENTFYCLYYKDHPIELQKWDESDHKLTFAELQTYFQGHPTLASLPNGADGLNLIANEYSTLSRAVHGSAKSFRMTVEGVGVKLVTSDVAALNQWRKRELQVITAINRLLMGLFRERLQGTALPGLRKAISLVFPNSRHADIKTQFGITLFSRHRP